MSKPLAKQIFINLHVKDLDKSMEFFKKLGFSFNHKFTDKKAACLILGDNLFSMLITHEFFKSFTKKEISDSKHTTETMTALSLGNRQEVDEMISNAIKAGGKEARPTQDYGWMYGRAFEDLDGHIWEPFYADENKIPPNPGQSKPDENNNIKNKKMNPVVHFEMSGQDMKRMKEFYSKVFGWETQQMGEDMGNYVVVMTSESDKKGPLNRGMINGGFYQRTKDPLTQHPSFVIAVDDLKAHIKKVEQAGGKILREPTDIPGVGSFVTFSDSEGNRVSMLQPLSM